MFEPIGPLAVVLREHDDEQLRPPPQWSALAGMLSGTLVLPGDAAYPTSALLYNELFAPQPAAVAYCATAADVQRCVAFARDARHRRGGPIGRS